MTRNKFVFVFCGLLLIRKKHVLTDAQIQQLLDPVKLTGLDKEEYANK